MREPRLEALYEQARALPAQQRVEFLDRVCGTDPKLRDELSSLLEQSEAAEEFFRAFGDALHSESFPADLMGDRAPLSGIAFDGPASAEPSTADDLPPGHEVGRYRIVERVARGGMGSVYRARDPRLGRDVALKFLPASYAADAETADRLLFEASAGAALDHPNLCTVFEIGEAADGRPFLAMAFYEGETLRDRLGSGPLPPAEVLRVAIAMARGLSAAHGRGIVHGDIKPGNVMLTAGGEVKLLDFGLARMGDVTPTWAGATFGTIAYMSPEQVLGEPLDARSDLWSLGVVLYEMLVGVRPFGGGDGRTVLNAVLRQESRPIREIEPAVPAPLAEIVARLLLKEREARYGSAADLLADLERLAARDLGRGPDLPVSRRGAWRRRTVFGGAAALLLVLVGVGIWQSVGGERSGLTVGDGLAGARSLAVLPLADRTADGRLGALADGMTLELIAMLGRNSGLRVTSSASAFAFKDRGIDPSAIGDSLGVSHLLEGSLEEAAGRIVLQVRLIDARDGSALWSETYERPLENAFQVQDELSREISRELDVRLAGSGRARSKPRRMPTVAAYEFYLRGNDQALLRSDSGVKRGVEYFKQAIAADSSYAAAYAGLARMYIVLGRRDDPGMPLDQLHDLARRAAFEALARDDSLAEAHAALGVLYWLGDADYAAAEAALKRAVDLDPTQTLPRQWLAQVYLQTGRAVEALAEASAALAADPLSPSAHAELAHALLANGRYDEALSHLEHIAAVQPPLLRAAGYTAQAYAMKGMWPEAIAAIRPQAEDDVSPRSTSLYGFVLARGGQREEARRVRDALIERWQRGECGAFDVALVAVGLGDMDEAFRWLERSVEDRSEYLMMPILKDLRTDPRFGELARRARVG